MVVAKRGQSLWKYRRIPYEFAEGFDYVDSTKDAMKQWEIHAGVKFVPRNGEQQYLKILSNEEGSRSVVGPRNSGENECYINNSFIALHELGHVLGLVHEQRRSDREDYVKLDRNRINPKSFNAFDKVPNSNNLSPYDYKSVMHYPAPAKGWGGRPSNKEVWTMRWRADESTELGAGAYQGWKKLSDYDKENIKKLYADVPVPMGPETDHGNCDNAYGAVFSYNRAGSTFLFGQDLDSKKWISRKVSQSGVLEKTNSFEGEFDRAYNVQFSYAVGEKLFCYGQSKSGREWFIREIGVNGRIGGVIKQGRWEHYFDCQFPFYEGDKTYLYRSTNEANNYWEVMQVYEGGEHKRVQIGTRPESSFDVQFAYSVGASNFLFAHDTSTRKWAIFSLESNGALAGITDSGKLDRSYNVMFSYTIGQRAYLYGQDLDSCHWILQRLTSKLGNRIQEGKWGYAYKVQVPFVMNGRQYFFGQNQGNDYNWFIQSLIDVI